MSFYHKNLFINVDLVSYTSSMYIHVHVRIDSKTASLSCAKSIQIIGILCTLSFKWETLHRKVVLWIIWIKRGWGDHYRYRARVRVMTLRSFSLIKSELRELILEYLIHLSLLTKTTYCPTDNPSPQNPPPSPIPSTPRPRKKKPNLDLPPANPSIFWWNNFLFQML